MARCAYIKPNGGRCGGTATGERGLCWGHDPENAEKRSRQASRAARAKTNKEVREIAAEIRALIAEVKTGEQDRNDAAVMFQGYRTLKDFIELARRVKETDDLEAEIAELKREHGAA